MVANGNIEYLTNDADILVLPHEYVDDDEKKFVCIYWKNMAFAG